MNKLSLSIKIYIALIIILAILAAINIFLPQGSFLPTLPEQELPASKPVLAFVNGLITLILHGGLGFLGLKLSQKLGFADIWDSKVSNKQRFLIPALIGMGVGVFFIAADIILSRLHKFGQLPHPPFPTSLVASVTAGIGEEVIFRLFFISFWVWLISYVILKKRWQEQTFVIIATVVTDFWRAFVGILPLLNTQHFPACFGTKRCVYNPKKCAIYLKFLLESFDEQFHQTYYHLIHPVR